MKRLNVEALKRNWKEALEAVKRLNVGALKRNWKEVEEVEGDMTATTRAYAFSRKIAKVCHIGSRPGLKPPD